jgi:hypothetical protein
MEDLEVKILINLGTKLLIIMLLMIHLPRKQVRQRLRLSIREIRVEQMRRWRQRRNQRSIRRSRKVLIQVIVHLIVLIQKLKRKRRKRKLGWIQFPKLIDKLTRKRKCLNNKLRI